MPNAQGKCSKVPTKDKYAFIALMPAIDMYHEARKSGVPLLTLEDMPPQVRRDFDPDPEMVKAYNAYLAYAAIGLRPVENALRAHMSLYYRYRKFRKDNLLDTTPYKEAPAPDRQFLKITNDDFKEGVRGLEGTDKANKDAASDPSSFHRRMQNAMAYPDKDKPFYLPRKLTSAEREILQALQNSQPLHESIVRFFDYYVHDSLAGFAQDGVRERSLNGQGHLRNRNVFIENG